MSVTTTDLAMHHLRVDADSPEWPLIQGYIDAGKILPVSTLTGSFTLTVTHSPPPLMTAAPEKTPSLSRQRYRGGSVDPDQSLREQGRRTV